MIQLTVSTIQSSDSHFILCSPSWVSQLQVYVVGNGIGSNMDCTNTHSLVLFISALVIIVSVSYALRDWPMKTGKRRKHLTTLQKEHCKRIGNRSLDIFRLRGSKWNRARRVTVINRLFKDLTRFFVI